MSGYCPNQNLLLIRAFPEINVRGGGVGMHLFKKFIGGRYFV